MDNYINTILCPCPNHLSDISETSNMCCPSDVLVADPVHICHSQRELFVFVCLSLIFTASKLSFHSCRYSLTTPAWRHFFTSFPCSALFWTVDPNYFKPPISLLLLPGTSRFHMGSSHWHTCTPSCCSRPSFLSFPGHTITSLHFPTSCFRCRSQSHVRFMDVQVQVDMKLVGVTGEDAQ